MITLSSARNTVLSALLTLILAGTGLLQSLPAAAAEPAAANSQPAAAADDSAPDPTASADNDEDAENSTSDDKRSQRFGNRRSRHRGDDQVSVGHDATLSEGTEKDSVVAVFGSASSYGTARQDVVSVFGNTTVKGPTQGSAVAVMGNVVADNDIGEDVVAVLGNVDLGPHAHVHGEVVSILGTVKQDPAAIVDGGVQRILPENIVAAEGVRHWIGHGLMMGRPLLFGSGTVWLWGLSFALLAVYVVLALLFRDATEHCIATLNEHPGESLVTAILAVLLTPLMLLLLLITVIGIPLIPIFLAALFIAGIFGKATVLGWIGGRCLSARPGHGAVHPALAVLVGGLIVMLAYLVPILGFVLYMLLSMIGYGAVLYTLLNRLRRHRASGTTPPASAPGGATPTGASGFADNGAANLAEPVAAAADAAAASAPAAALLSLATLPQAGFWPRMGALFIDALIVTAASHLVLGMHGRLALLALAIYGAVMWKAKGTTIGGIVFDLRVVRRDSRPLDWPTACVRALGCILSLCALGLGFIWIAIDPNNQAWHDKLAGTVVVRVPKGTPLV